jgi:hypothetical protein
MERIGDRRFEAEPGVQNLPLIVQSVHQQRPNTHTVGDPDRAQYGVTQQVFVQAATLFLDVHRQPRQQDDRHGFRHVRRSFPATSRCWTRPVASA